MGFLLGLPLAPLVRPTRLAPDKVTTARFCNLVRRTIVVKKFVAPQNGPNPGKIRQLPLREGSNPDELWQVTDTVPQFGP
jgi:hypothetical protein